MKYDLVVFDMDGTILNTIDKDTQAEQDEIKVDLTSFKIENIVLEISKPQTEGSLNFEITKAIEKDNDYSIEEIKEFTNLKSSLNVVAKNSDIAVLNETTEMVTKLEEPSQKVSIELENNRLSTVTTNEAVAIGVTLENDSIDDVMFINPNFKIIMPKYIEKLDIIAVEVMFDGELKVAETKVYDNEDGTKTIEVQLEGTQTTFNNPIAKNNPINVGKIFNVISIPFIAPFINKSKIGFFSIIPTKTIIKIIIGIDIIEI